MPNRTGVRGCGRCFRWRQRGDFGGNTVNAGHGHESRLDALAGGSINLEEVARKAKRAWPGPHLYDQGAGGSRQPALSGTPD